MIEMKLLKAWRNAFFEEAGKKRITRILVCSFVLALIWTFADLKSGVFSVNPLDDLICLLLGIMSERLIPWGKASSVNERKLRKQNVQLGNALKEATTMLDNIGKNYSLVKKVND